MEPVTIPFNGDIRMVRGTLSRIIATRHGSIVATYRPALLMNGGFKAIVGMAIPAHGVIPSILLPYVIIVILLIGNNVMI